MNRKSEKAVNDAIQGLAWEIENLGSDEMNMVEVLSKSIATLEMALASSADTK